MEGTSACVFPRSGGGRNYAHASMTPAVEPIGTGHFAAGPRLRDRYFGVCEPSTCILHERQA